MSSLTKRLRVLPVVMVLAAATLALKGSELLDIARAQAAPAAGASAEAQAPEAAAPSRAADDPAQAGEDASDSAAELDVLTSLAKRRAEIDARAKSLDMRANLLTAAEKRVDAKITDLKALETQIQGLLGKRDEAEEKQNAALVKVYASMKPRDAARIFNSLDEPVLLSVAAAMKPDSLAAIMAQMNPQQAQDLTVRLANRLKLPKKPDLGPAPQMAAAASPPRALPGTGAAPSEAGAAPAAAATASAPAAPAGPPGN